MFRISSRILRISVMVLMACQSQVMAEGKNVDKLNIGHFSKGSLKGWKAKEFKGQTSYKLVTDDGIIVLKAESNQAASGLYFEQQIDLNKTPFLNWRWRVDKALSTPNELNKAGDDFAARVYVVVSGGLIFWNTKAINYVWASGQPKDASWPNPFAGDHAMMVAMRSGDDETGAWYNEKRNIRDDFKKLMGEDIRYIDAIALMTDTDNGGGHAVAYYGDIYFTAQ